MKRWIRIVTIAGLLITIGIYNSAEAIITIDFDDISSGIVIDTYYEDLGVIFSTYGEGNYSDDSAYARSSTRNTSPPNVIGGYASGYTGLKDSECIGRSTLPDLTDYVSIWAIPPSSLSTPNAWLKVYDEADSLLGKVEITTGDKGENILLEFTSSSWNIYYVEFAGKNKWMRFDDLTFNPIPEPASLLLLIGGLAGMRIYAKRYR